MVGVQCESCRHRALFKPEFKSGLFKMNHQVVNELTRSILKCSECGCSEYSIVTLSSNLAHLWDRWLTGDASLPPAKPLIEGDIQG